MRVLLVAPGPRHSTFDVYRYWADALGRASGVSELACFAYHDCLQYHRRALLAYHQGVDTDPRLRASVIARASREILLDVWTEEPDVVFFVDGSQVPASVFRQVAAFREATRRDLRVVVHVTEAPFLDHLMLDRLRCADVVLVNDRASAAELAGGLRARVVYWPAAYSRDVHHAPRVRRDRFDVYFCGSIFPERARLLSAVDWRGLEALIVGPWHESACSPSPDLLPQVADECRPNAEVARDYRRSRIVLNLHRRERFVAGSDGSVVGDDDPPQAWSVGPRTVEAAACEAFQISDHRPELVELFGDAIPLFEGPEGLRSTVLDHLRRPEARAAMAARAKRVVEGMSFDDRAREFVDLLRALPPSGRVRSSGARSTHPLPALAPSQEH